MRTESSPRMKIKKQFLRMVMLRAWHQYKKAPYGKFSYSLSSSWDYWKRKPYNWQQNVIF